MGEKKADIRAERDRLANSAEIAAKELGTIASEIEYAITHLPRRTKNEYVALLQQQADRAQALANAFAAEEKAPDPGIMRHLGEVRGAFGLALFLALKSVVVGGLEHTGAEGVDAASPQIAALIQQTEEMADPRPITPASVPSEESVPGPSGLGAPTSHPSGTTPRTMRLRVGNSIEDVREVLQLSRGDFARIAQVDPSTVSTWESGRSFPSRINWRRINDYLDAVSSSRYPDGLAEIFEESRDFLRQQFKAKYG